MKFITKSKFMIGLKCPRCFWKAMNEDVSSELTIVENFRIDQGKQIGNLAKRLYPDGIDFEGLSAERALVETKAQLNNKLPIFEASFSVDDLYVKVDILVPNDDNSWDIVEVKSGTKIKEDYYYDTAFQKYVCTKSGLNINRCFVMHINNKYIKNGRLNLEEFFIKNDVTSQIQNYSNEIPSIIDQLRKIAVLDTIPEIEIKSYMKKAYPCDLKSECWSFLPNNNVTELYYMNQNKKFDLITNGFYRIEDVPDTILNKKQLIQKEALLKNKAMINKEGIKDFLDTLKYPLYYFDFETFAKAVPKFNGDKPYKQIPFQFSLHIESENGDIQHFEFLHQEPTDPRPEILREMKKLLGNKGSIIVFNQSFEKTRLKEMAIDFPEYRDWINETLERIIDLIIPFRNFYYYHPMQHGSCSIKKVLPAVTGKGYDSMEIGNGEDAYILYLKATYERNITDIEKQKIYDDLLKYCGLDTEGMIWIMNELKKMI